MSRLSVFGLEGVPEVVAGADAGEDAIGDADDGFAGGDETARLGE